MIKTLLFLIVAFNVSNTSAKDEMIICSSIYYKSVKKTVEASGSHDKYKHCAVSCLLALRCPATEVKQLGILKEGIDVVGPGNAEMADLEADFRGVKYATSKKAKTDKECINLCKAYYNNSCQ